jgi:hypothetical protein
MKTLALQLGPFPGMDDRDPRTHTRAQLAMNVDLSRGTLRGIEPPLTLRTHTGAVRGLAYHTKGDGTRVELAATATGLFADGTACQNAAAATAFAMTTGTSAVPFWQDGFRTLFVNPDDAAAPPYAWDERDGKVYSLTLPAAPSGIQATKVALTNKVINSMVSANGTDPAFTGGAGKWTVIGTVGGGAAHWDSVEYNTTPFGVNCPRLNSAGGLATGDCLYFTESVALDWSNVTHITFQVYSQPAESATGTIYGFCFGESGPNDQIIPFSIASAGTVNTVTVSLANIPTASRNAVIKWGFIVINPQQHVVSFKGLETKAGVVGKVRYLCTDSRALTNLTLTGPEGPVDAEANATVEIDAGTEGSQITLAWAALPAGITRKVYRWDEDQDAGFKYAGTGTSTGYNDTTADLSLKETLTRGRVQVPTGATAIGTGLGGRAILARPGYAHSSRIGDPTTWFDVTPEEHVTLQAAGLSPLTGADGLKSPVDFGEIVAIAPVSTMGPSDFRQDVVLFGTDASVVLTGDAPPFSVANRLEYGLCGPLAWCSTPGGLAFVDAQGDVNLLARDLTVKTLSLPLRDTLRATSGKAGWLLASDAATGRLTLLCGSTGYAYQGGEWTQVSTIPASTCRAQTGDGDGAFAVFGASTGIVRRAYDPAGTRAAWTWRGHEWSGGARLLNATHLEATAEGTVTGTAHGDAASVAHPMNGTAWRYGNAVSGRSLSVGFSAAAGDNELIEARLLASVRKA